MNKDKPAQSTKDASERVSEEYLELLFEKDRQGQWGQWVHGLIHNINGPLQNISMLVEMLIQGQARLNQPPQSSDSPDGEAWRQTTEKQSHRLKQLNQQVGLLGEMLQDFMLLHQIEQTEAEVDLKLVINKLARVFRADPFFKHQVKLELQLNDALPLVRILGRDLVPALVHVIGNALIAMRQASEKRLTIQSSLDGKWIHLIFKDSGCGLPAEGGEDDSFALFHSQWPQSLMRGKTNEKHFGFGLYAARRLLSPYGVTVSLKNDAQGAATILSIPVPS